MGLSAYFPAHKVTRQGEQITSFPVDPFSEERQNNFDRVASLEIRTPLPFLFFSQSDYLIQIVDINSHIQCQTMQIQISWLLQKPTDLYVRSLQRKDISGFSRIRFKSKYNGI